MTLQATNRLITAVLVATTGALVAVLTGRAIAAVLVVPWAVLVVLGLVGVRRDQVTARLRLDQDRVVVGGTVGLGVTVDGLRGGWVEVMWRPPIDRDDAAAASTGPTQADDPNDDQGTGADHDGDDDVAEDEDEEVAARAVAEVADPDGRAELRCVLDATAWGTHDVGRVEIRVHHPFGLTVARGLARQSLPLRVHPRPIDLRRLLAPWFVRRLTGAHRSLAVARGIEYADIRPFGPGDSTRDINWLASARSNELMVSQRHPDRSTHAILLVDSFTDSGLDTAAVLRQTIEAAMALAESHLSVSDRVGLIDLGGVVRWVTPGSGRYQLQRLVDALLATQLYRSEAERPITSVPSRALPPRSFVLALTPLVDRRFVDALFTLRAAGHDVAVVEFAPGIDARGERWNRTAVSPLALRLWSAERDVTRDRLAERGVAVTPRQGTAPTDDLGTDGEDPWDHVLYRLATARRQLRPLMAR